jgi:hypothetical protein
LFTVRYSIREGGYVFSFSKDTVIAIWFNFSEATNCFFIFMQYVYAFYYLGSVRAGSIEGKSWRRIRVLLLIVPLPFKMAQSSWIYMKPW